MNSYNTKFVAQHYNEKSNKCKQNKHVLKEYRERERERAEMEGKRERKRKRSENGSETWGGRERAQRAQMEGKREK